MAQSSWYSGSEVRGGPGGPGPAARDARAARPGAMPKKPKEPEPPTENEVELLVQALMSSWASPPEVPPEGRGDLARDLLDSVQAPGGVNVAWDVLTRTRKPFGKDAGIVALTVMLEALKTETSEGSGLDRSAIEPAAQLLALFCNVKPRAQVIVKQKKTMPAVIGVLKDWECSLASRVSSSWVLRRCTEWVARRSAARRPPPAALPRAVPVAPASMPPDAVRARAGSRTRRASKSRRRKCSTCSPAS